jgi:hypothetical protein
VTGFIGIVLRVLTVDPTVDLIGRALRASVVEVCGAAVVVVMELLLKCRLRELKEYR